MHTPDFITCSNSIPNGLMIDIDEEKPRIRPNNGMGGTGGKCFLPIALSNVYRFHKNIHSTTNVIGCGGISSGADAFKHILCGASAVQIGSSFLSEGSDIFRRCTAELSTIMRNKGYKNFDSFRGISMNL